MREIRFRAWDGKKMLMNCVIYHGLVYKVLEDTPDTNDLSLWIDTPDYPLMQFTGLKDESGIEIYEDDIIFLNYNRLGMRKVEFLNGAFNVSGLCISKCKVIGNIHENPELLEQSKC